MNFSDLTFWILLLAGLTLVALLRWRVSGASPERISRFDRLALAGLSLGLLLAVSATTLVIFLFVVTVTYCAVSATIARNWNRTLVLTVLLPLQFAPLVYFKYSSFVLNDMLGRNFDVLRHLVIPAGLSFYTFQKASFAIDTLVRKERLPNFLDFLNFASFFPMIVAGPIERKHRLLPQVERFRFEWRPESLLAGARWIIAGLFFKLCLSNNLAAFFDARESTNAFSIWIADMVFGFRIYYDFCGYSLIALGLAKCLGVELTLNFRSPMIAPTIQDFWRRWHITLSTWFRDYVYIPMGGNRVAFWSLNIMVVFVVSGIWHGASWGFVLWGALHGAYLLIASYSPFKLPPALSWSLTVVAVLFAWLFFYEPHLSVLGTKVATLANPANYTPGALKEALHVEEAGRLIAFGFFIVLTWCAMVAEYLSLRRTGVPYYYLTTARASALLAVLTILLAPVGQNEFIYFAF